MNTIEIELEDGTISRWEVSEDKIDEVTDALERIIGQPDTIKS
jgi:hypothetical protein